MSENKPMRREFPLLETLLAIAIIALILQAFPETARVFDVTSWSRTMWMGVNASAILLLIGVRFAPDLVVNWHDRRVNRAAQNNTHDKQKELRERRESLEQIKRARKRRLY
jgi:hypothetical protein